MSHQFQGTGVALVTPFQSNEAVDYNALGRLVDHVITGGVNYVVALGTTGETPTLTTEEKKEVLAYIVEKTNSRVPVVCGIGGNNTAEVVHQVKTFNLEGVAAILSVAPYYNKPTQEGMYRHFKAIAAATDKPVILYNVPHRTSSTIMPATAIRLANECSNVVAIKQATDNLPQTMELVQNKPPHFAILSGDDDWVLPLIAVGMEGIISVAANCYTSDIAQIVQLALAGNFVEARKLFYKLLPGINLLFVEGNPAGVKCALSEMGICENHLRLPLIPVSEETRKRLGTFIKGL